MKKKILKWYEAPQVEVVEMELQGILCVSTNDDNTTVEDPEDGGSWN